MIQQTLFNFSRPDKEADNAIAKKANRKATKTPVTVKGNGLLDKITFIRKFVEDYLGKYRDQYICIRDIDTLRQYVDTCLADRRIALDTETTGLNVFKDKIVGISLDSKHNKPAYIPINHVSYDAVNDTFHRIDTQLTIEEVLPELKRLANIDECDMFNAPFDRRVIKHNFGMDFPCTWDASLAARTLNENLPQQDYKLKKLHSYYCLEGKEDEFSFGEIFEEIGFDKVPIDIAFLYACRDSQITTELSDFQRQFIYYDPSCEASDRNGMNGASWCFFNIEMPCVDATIEMEENGIAVNLDYQKELSIRYNKKSSDILEKFKVALVPYKEDIAEYNKKASEYNARLSKGQKRMPILNDPINIGSPVQLAALIYDVFKITPPDSKKPRGTGEEILEKIDNPIIDIVREYKSVCKLLSSFIDKIPNYIQDDGKVHCNFNQYGARTGRYSSEKPNMQNIPSHNKDIRPMFVADDDCVLISMDYSQQEPKCLAALLKRNGDSQLYDTFMSGRQLYADIASIAFHKTYEECLEFHADGSDYPEGADRRAKAKKILLASLYGMGVPGIAKDLKITKKEAQKIKDSVYKGVPAIPEFERASLDFARENGYVTTISGRKRRLPDLMRDEFEFEWADKNRCFDALDFEDDSIDYVPDEICDKYWRLLHQESYKKRPAIIERARKKDGIIIIDNSAKVADATRQCVNSRIQGSAADLTKLAMIEVLKNVRLTQLGFKLLLQVHDELIGKCPKKHAKECAELLADTMSKAAEKLLEMPIKCDAKISEAWYGEPIKV